MRFVKILRGKIFKFSCKNFENLQFQQRKFGLFQIYTNKTHDLGQNFIIENKFAKFSFSETKKNNLNCPKVQK